ncbi:MAG: bifunctional riboflavin kinase/FAD synthetase [Gemmatimonadetes bacterium]|nr:bifunctional riboflavin kinase/FAD synthetase [Gemmatimonadota bacterium]MYH53625.1 bifunctional riboflavin kinase/FAD synthetase [Gemmatimonadota bacterium]MYK65593.1 bifunctional riboflavin kinase/FAD synthetase [Gemmatimonadota bacterium]
MTVFRDGVSGLPRDDRPVIVTVGTFDGVHLGHWSVLEEIGARAAAREGRSVLVTFDPHPLRIVRPEAAPKLLTTLDEKKVVLAGSRLDYVVFLAFTPELREYSPRRFVTEILLARLGMSELVIGYDHGFGRGRSGDVNTLRDIGAECGFAVDVVEAVHSGPGAISSSSIRRALAEGRVADANRGLGRPYLLTGTVVPGDGRGRELGFPTANLRVGDADKLIPAEGIYACRATVPAGRFMGALHIGPRPTFPGTGAAVEVFLLDFDGELYGQEIRLELIERLRSVEAFATAGALAEQMRVDVRRAREVLGER